MTVLLASTLTLACAPGGEEGGGGTSGPAGQETVENPPPARRAPCDPGFGDPQPRKGCPDPAPRTGWLKKREDGGLRLTPFRTLHSDAEGRAYALAHGLEFPFSNDYYDAPAGAAAPIELGPDTVCTGAIRVGYEEPLHDHDVDCAELVAEARGRIRLPVAVWCDRDGVVQVSELYRP